MTDETSTPPEAEPATREGATREGATRGRLSARRIEARAAQQPRFSQPVRQILLMLIVLALVAAGGWFAYGRIYSIFAANPVLNGIILGVFVLGVLACFWQVAQLIQSVIWIERFAEARRNAAASGVAAQGQGDVVPPRLLGPLATLLGGRGPAGGVISTGSARSILDSVATRIDEARDITRYLSNLLIFLGLLGTFYGLATTVPAVVETIRALAPQEGETGLEVFEKLMSGLEAQLGGMATAFSSSLLGLAGSLVVGLLELFVTHGQNRFYRELEEWMSSFTRIGLGGDEGDKLDQASLAAFLDRMADQMAVMQDFYLERDELREAEAAGNDSRIAALGHDTARLGAYLAEDAQTRAADRARMTDAMAQLAEGQTRLVALAEGAGNDEGGAVLRSMDEALGRLVAHAANEADTHMRLRSMDESLIYLAAQAETARPDGDEESRALLRSINASLAALQAPPAALQPDPESRDLLRSIDEGIAALAAHRAAEVEAYAQADDGAEARMRLRSIDVTLGRLVEEIAASRQDMMAELRGDIAHLTKSVQRLGGGG
ncbi:MAG: hypothetical protein Q4G36_02330 [Paracoccus sp. (in: a-proteobacteria)]|nr:hypothetical protein [Paracoccus sp. (in: a-proteobacteria)]